MRKIITVPDPVDDRKTKRFWAKHLTQVDRSKTNGYAFIGGWLRRGALAELPVGGFILTYDQPGSVKNWDSLVRLYRVTEDSLEIVYEWRSGDSESRFTWALAVRDDIADILEASKPAHESEATETAGVSTDTNVDFESVKAVIEGYVDFADDGAAEAIVRVIRYALDLASIKGVVDEVVKKPWR